MAGLRGNQGWVAAAKQASQGTAATVATGTTQKNARAGGGLHPVRETDRLAETDSSRDRGNSFATTGGVEGSPEFYARESSLGLWLTGVLGTDTVTGTTPNYTHTITPASALPYMTLWREVSGTLWEQYKDCKISGLTISAEAGQPLKATANVVGAVATRLTSDPTTSPAIALDSTAPFNFNNATVTLGGSGTTLVRSFELDIQNNVSRQQTDDFTPIDVVEGIREVSLSFEMIFADLTEYNNFHYGSGSGTAFSSSIHTTSAAFDFSLGTNNQVNFALPSIAYEEFPVDLNTNGDPITVQVRAAAQRSGSPVVTAVVKNQIASY